MLFCQSDQVAVQRWTLVASPRTVCGEPGGGGAAAWQVYASTLDTLGTGGMGKSRGISTTGMPPCWAKCYLLDGRHVLPVMPDKSQSMGISGHNTSLALPGRSWPVERHPGQNYTDATPTKMAPTERSKRSRLLPRRNAWRDPAGAATATS